MLCFIINLCTLLFFFKYIHTSFSSVSYCIKTSYFAVYFLRLYFPRESYIWKTVSICTVQCGCHCCDTSAICWENKVPILCCLFVYYSLHDFCKQTGLIIFPIIPQVEVIKGFLICPESGRKFPIENGIPNMLLNEGEVGDGPSKAEAHQEEEDDDSMQWCKMSATNQLCC